MEFPELSTERLQLVQITPDYMECYYEIMSKEEVTKYYGMDRLTTLEEAANLIGSFQEGFNNQKAMRWGMIHKETGEFIGTLGLNNLSLWGKKAEIGYELHPAYWRKGYTTEAVKEVLRFAFKELELFRIGAVTFPTNKASNMLLEKLGFTHEGLLRGYLYQGKQHHDAYVFSLLATEWERLTK
ncbi:GNAT family N-acetyltransferase [Mesobacillus maritimus]|uniref:GNAT family N-acetyltransferase n=1 Tax=Mesobacillus maritimus TaxID=1643336 RepID=UPI002040267E|nr:GNAT family N-acetyltransferase [Mesobacillus maritimus]MCM3668547.1 GNAT family N-acetyltransferase [Mesobacillus maritimus]